jgi:peptidyl-prolyl cis-trans isomerase C
MKAFSILLFACFAGLAQSPQQPPAPTFPDLPNETVICTFEDGTSMTVGEFKKVFAILPPEAQQNALKERENFIKGWAVMRNLARDAEKAQLDQASPAHEQLEYYRMRILAEAELEDAKRQIKISPAEARQYYDTHREKYKEVTLKAIMLTFSDKAVAASSSTSPNWRTEDEAKSLAAKLLADLRGGADFVKLVAQYSDDANSKAKSGDFATIRGSDNIPEQIRSVVMALKPGDVSEPVRQPNAIYVFRAEAVSYKPFEQASDEIFAQLQRDRYAQWMDQTNRNAKVEFKSPAFFGKAAGDPNPKPSGAH